MASGGKMMKTGSFVGTGALLTVDDLGFRPRYVKVINLDGLCTGEWAEDMGPKIQRAGQFTPELQPDPAAAVTLKTVTAGTLSATTAGEGVRPLQEGFALGVDSDLNVDGEVCHYVAIA